MTLFWLLKVCLKIHVANISCCEMFMCDTSDQQPPLFCVCVDGGEFAWNQYLSPTKPVRILFSHQHTAMCFLCMTKVATFWYPVVRKSAASFMMAVDGHHFILCR